MNKNIFGQNLRYDISVKGENIDYGVKVIETFKIQANKSIGKYLYLKFLNLSMFFFSEMLYEYKD
jgi:hypothetical protein